MKIRSFARRMLRAATIVTVLCAEQLAFANAVTLVPTGFANGSQSFSVSVPTVLDPNPVPAGAFDGTLDGTTPITFFCFELTQSFGFGNSYTYDDSVPSGNQFDLLSELFTEAFAHATDSTQNSAAFQLAVWEILEEGTPASLSPGVNQGTFYVTNDYGNTATVAAANALIAGLPPTGTYVIHLLHNDTNQDFVYGVNTTLFRVPEPAPLWLIGAALMAMLFGLRKVSQRRA